MSRLLPLLILAALVLAPFGRMSAAEAAAMPPHRAMPAAHCADQPRPGGEEGMAPAAIDCMIACAMATAAAAPFPAPPPAARAAPEPVALSPLAGIRPEAEPPPPRRA